MKTAYLPILLIACLFAIGVNAGHHRNVQGTVVAIDDEYGNIETDLGPAAIEELGLSMGDTFPVGAGDNEVKVYLGSTYSDVPRGDWVAFITSGGNLQIARNFENAAATLDVKVGDTITLFN